MRKILFCLSFLWTGLVSAQPMLVGTIPNASSNFIQGNNLVFFTSGDSLMVTDGTAGGTVLVKNGFTYPKPVTTIGDLLYFVSGSGQLWRSDGTEPGTYLLRTFSSREIENIYKSGSVLYFSAVTVAEGRELYRSDGTTGGTILLKDIYAGTGNGIEYIDYLQLGSTLYFQATDATHGKELWKTDGTTGGTALVKDVWPGTGSGYIRGLWESNGLLYFGGNDGTHGTELWQSDGTFSGTVMIKDVYPGAPDGFVGNTILTASNEVFFVANDATQKLNVWKTDGTALGTILIKDVDAPFAYSDISLFYTKEDHVYFSVYSHLSGEMSLWETDGTNMGTSLYKVLRVPFYGSMEQRVMNGIFFLFIEDGTNATMVVTDGTSAGSFVKTVGSGGDAALWNIIELNNHIVFGVSGQSGFWGHYKSDGTEAGSAFFTQGALDVPDHEVVIGDKLFFAKDDGAFDYTGLYNSDNFRQLFSTDLTNTSTFRDEYSISLIGSGNLFNLNGSLLFTTQNSPYDNSRPQKKQLWIHNTNPSQCLSSGSLLREFWANETGTTIASVSFETSIPDTSFLLTSFVGPSNVGTFYGARYRGYVCAPASGSYRFWISSNDASELWLSTDESPENKVKIASVATFTDPLQWNKFPSQQSASIVLEAGKKYYIEALHKQNAGTDHLAVGWQLPDNTYERPISGARLSPYVNRTPTIAIVLPDGPIADGDDIIVEADAQDVDGTIIKVEFYINDEKVGEDLTAPYTYTIEKSYGWYSVWARATDNSGAVTRSDNRNFESKLSPDRFTLVDATSNEDIFGIEYNSVVRMFPTRKINIRYNPVGNPGSVVFTVDNVQHRIESVAPFALGGDNNGDYHPVTNLRMGDHWLVAQEYSGSNGTGQLLYTRSLRFTIDSVIVLSGQYISHFTLYNAETNQPIRTMTQSTEINLDHLPTDQIAIVANTHPATVGSVRLTYGTTNRLENQAPYSLFGDNNGNLNAGTLIPGFNQLTAIPYSSNSGSGQVGYQLGITLYVMGSGLTSRLAHTVPHSDKSVIRCYPNPASTHVDISLQADAVSQGLVEIYDVSGVLKEKLFEGFLSEKEQIILNWKLTGVAPGVYLVKVTMDESVYTEKLIVR